VVQTEMNHPQSPRARVMVWPNRVGHEEPWLTSAMPVVTAARGGPSGMAAITTNQMATMINVLTRGGSQNPSRSEIPSITPPARDTA